MTMTIWCDGDLLHYKHILGRQKKDFYFCFDRFYMYYNIFIGFLNTYIHTI